MKLHDGGSGRYIHYCIGCDELHLINTTERNTNGAIWTFDGNMEQPTFNPSIDINKSTPESHCHYRIINGEILYEKDCFHKFAGQKITLPDIPDDYL